MEHRRETKKLRRPRKEVPKCLFERPVFAHPRGGGYYDLHTFTLCLSAGDNDEPSMVGSRFGHEILHWLQHIGTTSGGFLSMLSHIRDDHALNILKRYHWITDNEPSNARLISPYIPTASFFELSFGNELQDSSIFVRQSAWRDLLLCERIFLKFSDISHNFTDEDSLLDPATVVARALTQVHNWAIPFFCYRKPPKELRFDKDKDWIVKNFCAASYHELSLDTIDIIEGMSMALEIHSLSFQKPAVLEERFNDIAGTYYSRALDIFLRILGLSMTAANIVRTAPMFLSIAELSLQAPLPPFGIIGKIELDWEKIYPPLRFIKLSTLARLQSGYLIGAPWRIWIPDWLRSVRAQYLAIGGSFGELDVTREGFLPSEKSLPFLNVVAEEDDLFKRILISKAAYDPSHVTRFDAGKKQKLFGMEVYALLRNAHILSYNYIRVEQIWEILTEVGRESPWGSRFLPPLIVKNGEIEIGGWSTKFGEYLFKRNIQMSTVHDLILNRDPENYLEHIPGAISPDTREHVMRPFKEFCRIS